MSRKSLTWDPCNEPGTAFARRAELRASARRAFRRVARAVLRKAAPLVRVNDLEDCHQLFHYLRHRGIEQRNDRHGVDELLHGCAAEPAPPDQTWVGPVYPGATGGRHIIDVHGKVHSDCRLKRGFSRNFAVWCISRSSSPARRLVALWPQ